MTLKSKADAAAGEPLIAARLEGKVAVVTGGSRGIGAACARGLANAGSRVVVTYSRSREQAQAVVDSLLAAGGRAQALRADQADPEQAAELIARVVDEWGKLDILVNNAAVAVVGPIGEPPPQSALDRQLTVNYVSVAAAIRAAARAMAHGGRIINVGSGVATRTGVPGVADHAATKAALAAFTRGAARDLAERGITVNLVQSGLVDTALSRGTGGNPERLLEAVPMKRFGTPEEIAAGVLFLASPEASYVTGATLDIDGGFGA
jgi:NAD(P)-dependent dehydrogenase (short-subunit alcohol dehydrogenase family)